MLLRRRCPPPLSAAAAIIIATPQPPSSIAAAPAHSHCCHLSACLRQTSSSSLVFNYHTSCCCRGPLSEAEPCCLHCHLSSAGAANSCCSRHHLRLSSSICLCPLQPSFACPPSYLNLVDCCVIAIFSQCFLTSQNVPTGNTVGNPAAIKTGNTVTCHCTAASPQKAPPGALGGGGGYLTAGAKVNNKMLQQVVHWYPHCNNNDSTVGGLVSRKTASSGESVSASEGSSQ
jgi:hypothetical protein